MRILNEEASKRNKKILREAFQYDVRRLEEARAYADNLLNEGVLNESVYQSISDEYLLDEGVFDTLKALGKNVGGAAAAKVKDKVQAATAAVKSKVQTGVNYAKAEYAKAKEQGNAIEMERLQSRLSQLQRGAATSATGTVSDRTRAARAGGTVSDRARAARAAARDTPAARAAAPATVPKGAAPEAAAPPGAPPPATTAAPRGAKPPLLQPPVLPTTAAPRGAKPPLLQPPLLPTTAAPAAAEPPVITPPKAAAPDINQRIRTPIEDPYPVGRDVLFNRSSGERSSGYVSEKMPDGRVRVRFKTEDGAWATKVMSPEELLDRSSILGRVIPRPTAAPPGAQPPVITPPPKAAAPAAPAKAEAPSSATNAVAASVMTDAFLEMAKNDPEGFKKLAIAAASPGGVEKVEKLLNRQETKVEAEKIQDELANSPEAQKSPGLLGKVKTLFSKTKAFAKKHPIMFWGGLAIVATVGGLAVVGAGGVGALAASVIAKVAASKGLIVTAATIGGAVSGAKEIMAQKKAGGKFQWGKVAKAAGTGALKRAGQTLATVAATAIGGQALKGGSELANAAAPAEAPAAAPADTATSEDDTYGIKTLGISDEKFAALGREYVLSPEYAAAVESGGPSSPSVGDGFAEFVSKKTGVPLDKLQARLFPDDDSTPFHLGARVTQLAKQQGIDIKSASGQAAGATMSDLAQKVDTANAAPIADPRSWRSDTRIETDFGTLLPKGGNRVDNEMLAKMTIEVKNAMDAKIQELPGLLTGQTIDIAGGPHGGGSITDAIGRKHGILNLGNIVKDNPTLEWNQQNRWDSISRNELLNAVKDVREGVPGAQSRYDIASQSIAASIVKRIQSAILDKPELIKLFNK